MHKHKRKDQDTIYGIPNTSNKIKDEVKGPH